MATYNFDTSTIHTKEGQRSLLSRTFIYMFLFMLITIATSAIVILIFQKAVPSDQLARVYNITMITAIVTQLVLTIVIAFTSIKQGKGSIVPFTLYSICMGVLISSFGMFLNPWTLTATFGIAALAFVGMALIGYFSKNASGMGMVGFGLLFGVLLCSLFNIIMFIFVPGSWAVINIITSVVVIIAILLITAYDVWNIKKISQVGMNSGGNLAIYLAFNLYVDFIVILVHLLRLVVIASSNR